jgi:hypothetical protein
LLVAVAALAATPAAGADRGVAIDVARIAVAQDLAAGGAYRLPSVGVRNAGTVRTAYRLRVSYVEGQEARRPDAGWFAFSPGRLTLAPGESRAVSVRLILPPGAEPGEYEALLGAEIAGVGEGARVGAAAAARLSFTVAPSSLLEGWWLRLKTLAGDWSPWSYLLPALALALLGAWQVRRRLTISVERR